MDTAVLIKALSGLLLGGGIGAIAQATTFCSVGAVGDVILAKDWRRLRSWAMAAAVALIGTQALALAGLVDLAATPYRMAPIGWAAISLGSLAFGFGMSQAGGCVQRALVRMGSGSVKSLATLVLTAAFAAATFRILPDGGAIGIDGLRVDPGPYDVWVAAVIAAGLLIFCLKDKWFRSSPGPLWGGVVIGGAVVLAWGLADGHHGLNLLVDLGIAGEKLAGSAVPTPVFGISVLPGIALGAFLVAAKRDDLYVDRFTDSEDVKRHLVGGILMGIGGALAYGCSFGQGLVGFSTLSVNALIAIIGMGVGCLWGIRTLEAGSAWGGLKLLLWRA